MAWTTWFAWEANHCRCETISASEALEGGHVQRQEDHCSGPYPAPFVTHHLACKMTIRVRDRKLPAIV